MLLPSIVGAVVPDSPTRGTLVLTSRRPRGTPSKACFCFSSPHAPCNALPLTFSCCTGHTTYSPEGGVHNNTCRGSSESTIQVEEASCCQPVADDIIHLQSGSPFRPKRAVSSVPFTRQTLQTLSSAFSHGGPPDIIVHMSCSEVAATFSCHAIGQFVSPCASRTHTTYATLERVHVGRGWYCDYCHYC